MFQNWLITQKKNGIKLETIYRTGGLQMLETIIALLGCCAFVVGIVYFFCAERKEDIIELQLKEFDND